MICPHCNVAIKVDIYQDLDAQDKIDSEYFVQIFHTNCPACERLIVTFQHSHRVAKVNGNKTTYIREVDLERFVYPQNSLRFIAKEVPEPYRTDYTEAANVLSISPKASAALSRRLLQRILREEFKIQYKDLYQEIDAFINQKDTPSYLAQAIDAIRNVGNFAAHPLKITNTGEIVDVEPGEAEWLLDVLDMMFDHSFVQPMRLEEQKQRLNAKLQSLGKPLMKNAPPP